MSGALRSFLSTRPKGCEKSQRVWTPQWHNPNHLFWRHKDTGGETLRVQHHVNKSIVELEHRNPGHSLHQDQVNLCCIRSIFLLQLPKTSGGSNSLQFPLYWQRSRASRDEVICPGLHSNWWQNKDEQRHSLLLILCHDPHQPEVFPFKRINEMDSTKIIYSIH